MSSSGAAGNPYKDLAPVARLESPDGTLRQIPLFWDGADRWKLRFSPDEVGTWRWQVDCVDPALQGQCGTVSVTPSETSGGLTSMDGHPTHFSRRDGTPFWFFGDTAWALLTDDEDEQHNRGATFRYIDKRVAQGYNVFHAMAISEAGWGNSGGNAFHDLRSEKINPAYWQEADERVRYVNAAGATLGLVLAWADKSKNPNSWRAFPSQEARLRYARYMAARYSAYDVYFIVAGEWDADTHRGLDLDDEAIAEQYREMGRTIRQHDPHNRLVGIHPMFVRTSRQFAADDWCGFGDYQQMYPNLHGEILTSGATGKPVANAEYAYFLRDQDEDGVCDKENSNSIDIIRHATWDILMAEGYAITGFGSTYLGGHRHPGPFNPDDPHLCLFVDPEVRRGYDDPDEAADFAVEMVNAVIVGMKGVTLALHLCRRAGARGRGKECFTGGFEPIIGQLNRLKVDHLAMEFAAPDTGELAVLARLCEHLTIGLGCVDVTPGKVDSIEAIVDRVRRATRHVSPSRITLNPDCGFEPGSGAVVSIDEAYTKLENEVAAARRLREEFK